LGEFFDFERTTTLYSFLPHPDTTKTKTKTKTDGGSLASLLFSSLLSFTAGEEREKYHHHHPTTYE